MNPEGFKNHKLTPKTRINIVVTTVDGSTFVSDTQSVEECTLDDVYDAMSNFSDLTSFNITSGGDKVFFNPAHIVSIKVATQATL